MTTLTPIPAEALPSMVGKPIHLAWADKGCVWILDRIDGDALHLRASQSGRTLIGKATDACYTRRYQPAGT